MKNILTLFAFFFTLLTFGQSTAPISKTNFFVDLNYGLHIPTNGHVYKNGLNKCDEETIDFAFDPEYSNIIHSFEVDNFVQDVIDSGAGYIVLNLGQSDGKYCSPNQFYQAKMLGDPNMVGYITSKRDLPDDIYSEIQAKDPNIKLFLYFNLDGPGKVKAWKPNPNDPTQIIQYYIAKEHFGLGYDYNVCEINDISDDPMTCGTGSDTIVVNAPPFLRCAALGVGTPRTSYTFHPIEPVNNHLNHIIITQAHVDNISNMIKEWSDRYGSQIAGWFFDHAYSGHPYALNNGSPGGFNDLQLEQIKNAALNGSDNSSPSNPDAIVTFNNGAINYSAGGLSHALDYTKHQHFTAGEVSPNYSGDDIYDPATDGFPLIEYASTPEDEDDLMSIWKDDEAFFTDDNLFRGRKVYDSNSLNHFSQFHLWIPFGDRWGTPNVNEHKVALKFNEYLGEAIKENGVTTISVANILADHGRIKSGQLSDLIKIKQFVRDDNCEYRDNSVKLQNVQSQKFARAPEDLGDFITQETDTNTSDLEWILEEIELSTPLDATDAPEILPATEIQSIKLVRIFNTKTHKYMTVEGGNYAFATKIVQKFWNDWGSQKWMLIELSDGKYVLRGNHNTGWYITIQGGSTANGAKLQLNAWNNWASQKWLISNPTSRLAAQPIKENIKLFPNPTKSNLNVVLDKDTKDHIIKVEIRDRNGRVLSTQDKINSNTYMANFSAFKRGLYFVKIYTNQQVVTEKIIKE